jgi:hypothetical protein
VDDPKRHRDNLGRSRACRPQRLAAGGALHFNHVPSYRERGRWNAGSNRPHHGDRASAAHNLYSHHHRARVICP